MNALTYAELQALRSQAHDEARRLGYTAIDLDAVEAAIAKRDADAAIPLPPLSEVHMSKFSMTLEGQQIEVTTTNFRGGHHTRFYAAQDWSHAPGWFIYGRNPAYNGKYSMVVARPDAKARKRPNWNALTRAGWRTLREARAVAALLNERDAANYDEIETLGPLHGTYFRTEKVGDLCADGHRDIVDARRCARLRGEVV